MRLKEVSLKLLNRMLQWIYKGLSVEYLNINVNIICRNKNQQIRRETILAKN